jgi:hypothetical protein
MNDKGVFVVTGIDILQIFDGVPGFFHMSRFEGDFGRMVFEGRDKKKKKKEEGQASCKDEIFPERKPI